MARLEADKLIARLAAGNVVPAVLLEGDDAYLRESLRSVMIEKLVPESARDWGVLRFSLRETDLEEILGRAQTLPLLAPRQVILVSDLETLQGRAGTGESGEEEKEGSPGETPRQKAMEQLAEYLDDPAPFTTLVFEAAQLDQRMKLYKLLSEKALVVAMKLEEGTSQATLVAMARRMARDLGVEIEPAAAEELVDLVDGQLVRVRAEMEKLAAYAGERKRITEADVDALVVSEKKYSIWQLADMLASLQRARALEFLNGVLREGEEPAGIVGALAWMYRTMIQAQELPRSANAWDVVRQLHIRKDTAEIALAACRRIPRAQLLAGLEALYEADSRLKSGVHDQRGVLEFLLARLTAPLAQSKPA